MKCISRAKKAMYMMRMTQSVGRRWPDHSVPVTNAAKIATVNSSSATMAVTWPLSVAIF